MLCSEYSQEQFLLRTLQSRHRTSDSVCLNITHCSDALYPTSSSVVPANHGLAFEMSLPLMAGVSSFSNSRPLIGRLPGSKVGEMLDQGIATSNKVPHPRVALTGPVAILWDIENCPVPGDVNADEVAGNIRMALRVHPAVKGAVTMFSAYGDFNHFPRRLREGCQRTGVNLIDVPNGKKDASDKAILVDMFLFALDNPPPCTILLISGDVDFAPALHKLGQRGYTMVLAIPAGVGVSSVLCNAGRFVWDWPSVARGDGLVPAKTFLNRFGEDRMTEMSAYMMGSAWQSGDESDVLAEDERYMYSRHINNNNFLSGHVEATQFSVATSLSHGGPFPFDFSKLTVSQGPLQSGVLSSQGFPGGPSCQNNQVCSLPLTATSCGKALPSSSIACLRVSAPQTPVDFSSNAETEPWVQPGDLQGLKGQLTRILKLNGGKVQLLRIPSEYCKLFGRPLYLAEYGSPKLVHLIERMPDAFFIKGEGNRRTLHLKDNMRTQLKHRKGRANASLAMSQPDKLDEATSQGMLEGDDFVEDIILLQRQPEIGSDDEKASEANEESDGANKVFGCLNEEGEALDGDAYMAEVMLEVLKQEVQELLVSHACTIPLSSFETLYKQRYAHELDVAAFGVEDLELLFAKLEDVAIVRVDKACRKFLVANYNS